MKRCTEVWYREAMPGRRCAEHGVTEADQEASLADYLHKQRKTVRGKAELTRSGSKLDVPSIASSEFASGPCKACTIVRRPMRGIAERGAICSVVDE